MAYQKLTPEQIEQIAREQGASPSLVNAVINQESKGNISAVSPKGAQGLMQIMPDTGAEVAKNLGYSNYDIYEPKTNVTIGSNYLAQMQKKYGDERLALAAYNSGPGKIDELQQKYGKEYEKIAPHLYQETKNYVPGVQSKVEPGEVLKNAAKGKIKEAAIEGGKDALFGGAGSAGTTAFSSTATGSTAFSGGSTFGGTAVGSAANGGTLMSTGQVIPGPGASVGESLLSTGTVAPAGEAVGSTTAPAAAGGMSPALGAVGAGVFLSNIYEGGGKDIIRGKGKRDDYTNLVLDVNPVTAPINMGLRALGMRSVGKMMSGGKSDDQMGRDEVRKSMKSQGMFATPGGYDFLLADGTSYDIGRDGGARLLNADGKTDRGAYDVDFSNPLAAETTAQSMALGMILTGGHKKLSDDFTGYITNAGLSNAKDQTTATQNLQAITKQMMGSGLTQDSAKSILDQLKANNRIDVDSYNVAVSKLPILFGTSQPITAVGAATQKKGGGSPEIAIQGPTPSVSPQLNPHLRTAVKNTSSGPTQSQAGAFRR